MAAYGVYCHYRQQEFKLVDALCSAAIVVVGSIAPDVLEPAVHPNHRSIFHSIAGGAAIVHGARGAWGNSDLSSDLKSVLALAAIGYVLHLLADAATPRGLPLVY